MSLYPETQSFTVPSAVIFATVKLIDRVGPRKEPAWKGNFPPHGAQLETTGPGGREGVGLLQKHLLCVIAHLEAPIQPTHSSWGDRNSQQVVAAALVYSNRF